MRLGLEHVSEDGGYLSHKTLTVIGCVIGAGLTLAIIVLLVLFNSYIEDEDDIAKLFDAPVVGKIPNFTLYDDNGERKKGFFSKKGGASK